MSDQAETSLSFRFPDAVEAVIFDLDGVILDSEPIHLTVTNEMLAASGADPLSWDEYAVYIGHSDTEFFSYLQSTTGTARAVDELIREYKHRLDVYYNEAWDLPVIPGVRDLVRNLAEAGYPLAIASSSSHVNINHALRAAALEAFFPIRVSGEDVVNGKPAPDIYLEAARQLGVEPNKAAAIEDSEAGVISAASAGLFVIGFESPGSGNQDLGRADLVLADFSRLFYGS